MAAFDHSTLKYRQRRLYTHRCDVFRPVQDIPPGSYPGDIAYVPAETDVPCIFNIKSDVDAPQDGAGLLSGDDLITVDTVNLPLGVPAETNYVLVNRSLVPGTEEPTDDYGRAWVLKGGPQRIYGAVGRPTDHQVAYVAKLPVKPAGVA